MSEKFSVLRGVRKLNNKHDDTSKFEELNRNNYYTSYSNNIERNEVNSDKRSIYSTYNESIREKYDNLDTFKSLESYSIIFNKILNLHSENSSQSKYLINDSNKTLIKDSSVDSDIDLPSSNVLNAIEQQNYFVLESMIKNDNFEVGYESNSLRFFDTLYKDNRDSSLKVINKLFIASFSSVKVVVGVLHILSSYSYEKVDPNGATIALAASLHQSDLVKEALLLVFEKWSNEDALRLLLDNVKFENVWLEKYRLNLINDIEELLNETTS